MKPYFQQLRQVHYRRQDHKDVYELIKHSFDFLRRWKGLMFQVDSFSDVIMMGGIGEIRHRVIFKDLKN